MLSVMRVEAGPMLSVKRLEAGPMPSLLPQVDVCPMLRVPHIEEIQLPVEQLVRLTMHVQM